jgi:hypothetical protein
MKRKPRGYWTKERCEEEASKYKTKREFQKNCGGAYNASYKNGWSDEICKDMIEVQKPTGYWTKERCEEEASKYKTRSEFQKNCGGAYSSAHSNGWLDEICKDMIEGKKPNGYWTKKNCAKEVYKYKTRSEFQKNSKSAWGSARRNGWLDEICKDMDVVGNKTMRCIYVFEFEDNYVYVGLTYNFKVRYNEHMSNLDGVVYKHIEKTGLTPKYIQLTDYLIEEEARIQEGIWEGIYRSNGWNILNIAKTGSLGGTVLKWDYETCKEETSKYKTRYKLQKNNPSLYSTLYRNGWLDEFLGKSKRKPIGYWTYEKCNEEALKYITISEFQKNSSSAYNTSRKNNWLDEFFPKNK